MIKHPDFANPVLSKEEAREVFSPYVEKFRKVISDTWHQWETCPQRHALDARARASFISSFFRHFAKSAFAGDTRVTYTENGNSFFLYVGKDAKVRLKKLRANGTYSNIMTGRQLRLIKQMDIPGMLPGTYLTIGYQLDDSQQKIRHKKITLQSYRGIIYSIDLDDASTASSAAPIAVMPQIPPQSNSPRARARKEAIYNKEKHSGDRE
jgi:hypothetical protein